MGSSGGSSVYAGAPQPQFFDQKVCDGVQVLKGFHWRANRFVAIKKINVFEKASTGPYIGQRSALQTAARESCMYRLCNKALGLSCFFHTTCYAHLQ